MTQLEFQLLGTMLIRDRPAREVLPGARARQLLAVLLQHPNRYVSFDTIADNLWEERPPKSAAANLRTHIGTVRRTLGEEGLGAEVQTRPGGYQILVDPDRVDSSRMESLLAEARHLAGVEDHDAALALADEALALWRGSPFEDLTICSAWAAQIARWELLHAEVLDLAIGLHVEHGDPWRAAGMVRERLDADRYDESAWCQLVRCCLAGGMLSQAVQALADARQVLADELGTEPGPELQDLEQRVRDDPKESGLFLLPGPESGPRRDAPSQLPHDLNDFSGRADELDQAVAMFDRRPDDRPSVLIVTGPPGVGKTAFVTHAAHHLRDTYPDGQIYLDLRGTTTPVSAPFAVTEVLSAVGISNPSDELDRAAALLRSELASRRLLLVVDNAASAEQVLPLLPGTGESAVLITSRRRLTDVTGAVVLDLDVLPLADAAQMVGRIAEISDPGDQELLAEACGCHPLAIRIASGRLLRRPDLTVQALAARLTDPGRALHELTLGEVAFSSSAQLSCSALPEAAAQGFRTLGALELGEFDGLTVEAAAGPGGVDSLLEENLLRVDRSPDGRVSYLMHDLLRFHARHWAEELQEDVSAGVGEVLSTWLGVSGLAAAALPSFYFGLLPQVPAVDLDPGTAAAIEDPSGSWFDGERRRLDAMLASAIRYGHVGLAWRLVVAWSPYFDLRGHTRAWISALEQVLEPVRAGEDRLGTASILRDIGQVSLYRDAPEDAVGALTESRALFLEIEEWAGAAFASIGLAVAEDATDAVGEHTLAHCTDALEWFRRADHLPGIAAAHNACAMVHLVCSRPDRAERDLTLAAAAAREAGDRHREAQVLRRTAELDALREDVGLAERHLSEALEIFLELGDHRCAGYASTRLGRLMLANGNDSGARRQFREALAAGRRLADPAAQAEAWSAMAEALQSESQSQAVGCLRRSVRAWQVADHPRKAAEASARLADLQRADDGPGLSA